MGAESSIIPTPAHVKYGADLSLTGADRKLRVALSPDPGVKERIALQTLRAAVTALGGSVAAVSEPGAARVVLVLLGADGAAAAGAPLDAEDLATFAQPNGAEQGYVIRPAAGASAPLYIRCQGPRRVCCTPRSRWRSFCGWRAAASSLARHTYGTGRRSATAATTGCYGSSAAAGRTSAATAPRPTPRASNASSTSRCSTRSTC